MNRVAETIAALLVLSTFAGCATGPCRYVDPRGKTWEKEHSEYPQVLRRMDRSFPPSNPEGVAIYDAPQQSPPTWMYGAQGSGPRPPEGLLILGELKVFRGSLPDHEGARAELRRIAARLGATALLELRCTVILGEKYVGGIELVGWTYEAKAACAERQRP